MDVYKTHVEKAKGKLHKNAVDCHEQILEATPLKAATVRILTSHLANHASKTNKTYGALLKKQVLNHKRCFLVDTCTWTSKSGLHILTARVDTIGDSMEQSTEGFFRIRY